MVRLREIPRTATFAWSPGAASPLIATGTRAGAVDVNFSNETCLELWDLQLDREEAGTELQPIAKIGTDSGYGNTQQFYWFFGDTSESNLQTDSMIWPGQSPMIIHEALSPVVWRMVPWISGMPTSC